LLLAGVSRRGGRDGHFPRRSAQLSTPRARRRARSARDRCQACGDQQSPCRGTHDDGEIASVTGQAARWIVQPGTADRT